MFTYDKSSTLKGLVYHTNMATVLLFWDTKMVDVTACEKQTCQVSQLCCKPHNLTTYLMLSLISHTFVKVILQKFFWTIPWVHSKLSLKKMPSSWV